MKKIRTAICIILSFASVFAFSANALAVEESFTITGAGGISVEMGSGAVFTAATDTAAINLGQDIVFSGSRDDIAIVDETGTNSGWKFSIAATDFHATGIDDPTDAGTADMDVFVSCGDWLSIDLDNSAEGISSDGTYTLEPGTGGEGAVVDAQNVSFLQDVLRTGTPNGSATASDTVDIIDVDPGYGAGKYLFDLNYSINISNWMPEGSRILSPENTGGRFEDMSVASGDKIQVFAGTYSAEITYAACCNPAS